MEKNITMDNELKDILLGIWSTLKILLYVAVTILFAFMGIFIC